MVDISRKDKSAVLVALYNAAQPLGMSQLNYVPGDMSLDEARILINNGITDFDYLKGRVMKIDISGETLDTRLYNRDNGPNAAEIALEKVPDIFEPFHST